MNKSSLIGRWELLADLRRFVAAMGSQQAAARRLGVSGAYLSDVLNERREPAAKLLKALGYRRAVLYERDVKD